MKLKHNRRRAINCSLQRKSRSNPGYFKYNVTISEKDGTTHTEPCYGKDMQDALSRLINTERTIKIEKKMERNPLIFFIAWLLIMVGPVILIDAYNTPWFILYMFGSFTALFLIIGWWQNYLEKGK